MFIVILWIVSAVIAIIYLSHGLILYATPVLAAYITWLFAKDYRDIHRASPPEPPSLLVYPDLPDLRLYHTVELDEEDPF